MRQGIEAGLPRSGNCRLHQSRSNPDEAIANVRDAMLGWISIALEDGRDVPQPRTLGTYSGKFIVRVPSSLHADLVRTAAREVIPCP